MKLRTHALTGLVAVILIAGLAALPAWATEPNMKPGAARPWGADMSVSTYSSVNLWDGNLMTSVPIIGWNGVGPDMQMVLYHNAANVDSPLDLNRGLGFDMGPGWSCTFSGQVIYDDQEDTALVIHDDGTQDLYEWDSQNSEWDPPTGVYAVLTRDSQTDEWTLRFKNQTYRQYDDDGLLIAVGDACGNEVTIVRETVNSVLRINYVYDAAGRKLDFDYRNSGVLKSFIDPICDYDEVACTSGEPGLSTLTTREWVINYDASDRLKRVTDPLTYEINIDYDAGSRIDTIEEKNGNAFDYDYNGAGRLTKVTDPDPAVGTPLDQDFSYTYTGDPSTGATVYTDRRGNNWDYDFDSSERIYKARNPFDKEREYTWDSANNLTDFYNELDDQWEFTYDARGNLLKMITPLTSEQSPKTVYTYDTLNNVTSVTDGEGNTTTYTYGNDANCSTFLESIEIPAPDMYSSSDTIALTYYSTAGKYGLLEDVIFEDFGVSARDVVLTHYEYDDWGQLAEISEGALPQDASDYFYTMQMVTDSGSRIIQSIVEGTYDGGDGTFDLMNRQIFNGCIPILPGGGSPLAPEGFPTIPSCVFTDYSWLPSGGWSASYDAMGRVTELTTVENQHRVRTNGYDELGRLESQALDSHEADDLGFSGFERDFSFDHDWANDKVTVSGPDGQDIVVTYDAAGRVDTVTRQNLTADYAYFDDGQVSRIDYGNDTYVLFTYDDDGRLATKQHYDAATTLFLKLTYTYDDRDLPTQIVESNAAGTIATVTFDYDDRGRLIAEERAAAQGVTTPEYDLAYDYDQMGNRLTKEDYTNALRTEYTYDVDDPDTYGSDNNRLMMYTVSDVSGQDPVLESTTWYYYNAHGNPERIVTEDAQSADEFTAVRLVYDSGQHVVAVAGEYWTDSGACGPQGDYALLYVREFRYEYDEPRAKYLTVERDCDDPNNTILDRTWTDYLGGTVYGDFQVTASGGQPPTPVYTELTSFLPGIGTMTLGNVTTVLYDHADHLGTLRALSDAGGDDEQQVVYTAFGERVGGPNHRYGYVGALGYRAHEDFACDAEADPQAFPYLHVGWRYYDPASGRFLQRDPIGIGGGFNVYEYVRSNPASYVDPLGLDKIDDFFDHPAIRGGGVLLCVVALAMSGPAAPFVAGAGILGWGGGDVYDFLKWANADGNGPPPIPRGKCVRGCHAEPGPPPVPFPDPLNPRYWPPGVWEERGDPLDPSTWPPGWDDRR